MPRDDSSHLFPQATGNLQSKETLGVGEGEVMMQQG